LRRGTTHRPAEGRAIAGGLSRPVAGASWVDTTLGRSFDEPNTGLFHPITNRGALHHHESATVAGQSDLARDRFLNPRSNPGCRTGHKIVDEEPAFASRGNGPHEMLGQLGLDEGCKVVEKPDCELDIRLHAAEFEDAAFNLVASPSLNAATI
jgi:hypothetical protein